jgi:hypothetical protein
MTELLSASDLRTVIAARICSDVTCGWLITLWRWQTASGMRCCAALRAPRMASPP